MTSILLILFVIVLAGLVALVRLPSSRWRGLLGRHDRACPVTVGSDPSRGERR